MKKGISLIENLVTIVLVSIIVIATIGGFVVARVGAIRSNHRTIAISILRNYMEQEISNGYFFGQYATFASATPVQITGDGAVVYDVTYTVTPEPYPPTDNTEGSRHFKTVGFRVQWNEPLWGGAGSVTCSERAATYIAQHT